MVGNRVSAVYRGGVFVPEPADREVVREGEQVELVVLVAAAAQRAALLRELAQLLRENPFLAAVPPPRRLRW